MDFEIHHAALAAAANLSKLVSLLKARSSRKRLGVKAQEALAHVIHQSNNVRRCLDEKKKKLSRGLKQTSMNRLHATHTSI